jgi:hypothetical protein
LKIIFAHFVLNLINPVPLLWCGSNALKFTPFGGHIQVKASFISDTTPPVGIQSTVSVSRIVPMLSSDTTTEKNGKIRIEILDSGPGISEVSSISVLCLIAIVSTF